MRIIAYFLISLGILILFGQIFYGEVCISRAVKKCISYSKDPKMFWHWFFLMPSIGIVSGIFLLKKAKKPNIYELVMLALIVVSITMTGLLVSSFY